MFRRRLSCRFATLTAPSRHASTVPSGVDTTPVAIEPTLDATLDDETRHALLRIKPETPQRYLVEVANVSSAACRFCGLPVVSESLRIGALISSGSGDFTFPSFIHAECLTGGYRRAYPGAMRDWRLISGVARLPPSDIARVVDIVFGADHVIDPKQAKLLTKQSAALSMAEAALRDASAKEIAAMLVDVYGKPADKVFNMHPKGPSKPLVLSVLADALVFGPVEPCDACGSICKPTARGYECLGYIDEYTRCTNSRPTVKRLAGNAKWTALTKRFAVGHITDDCILHPRVLDAKSKPVEALATLPADSIDVFDGLHFDGFSPKDIAGLVSHGGNMIGKSDTRALPAHVVRRGPQASKSYKSIPATAPTVSDGWVHHCSKVGTTIHSPTAHKFFTANGPKKDPAEDLEKYIKLQRALHEEQVAKKTPNTTGAKERNVVVSSSGVAVDSEVPNAASYRVVVGSGGVPFHASLTKTDLASGRNSFYVLQLLVETTTNRYLVWRRWGRVGELIGGSKLEAGSETDFAKLFHERTGNNWPPNNFQKKAGLMDMVHVDYSVPSDDKGKKTNGKKGAKATGGGDGDGTGTGGGILLDKPTRSLMQLMFNKDIIVETMQMMKIDTEKLPLGNLSTTTLEQGSAILLEIQKLVNGAQQAGTKKNSKTNKGTDGPVDFTNAQKQQLLSLSNRFYSKVPQRIERGADASIAILDDMNKIAAQADLLRDLLDIVQTKNILDMSQQSTDPAAAHLQSLSTKFEHLPRGPELDAVRQYFTSTRGSTHDAFELLDVWRIARCNEAERFKPWSDDTNRKLLWHGSRLTNWVAILTQGLRIAPPEAPVSGYMFGKGIYFADMMSKSANYCRLYGATHGLMALAEVSLGKPHVLYDSDSSLDLHAMKKFGCRSTFALGRDGPAAFAPFPHLPGCTQGLQVPVYSRGDSTKVDDGGGASRRSRSLMYNEYIVYDVAQVHLRYLLRIKQA